MYTYECIHSIALITGNKLFAGYYYEHMNVILYYFKKSVNFILFNKIF